jgi:hypothetical protein
MSEGANASSAGRKVPGSADTGNMEINNVFWHGIAASTLTVSVRGMALRGTDNEAATQRKVL